MNIGDVILHPLGEKRKKGMSLPVVIVNINTTFRFFFVASLLQNGRPSKDRRKHECLGLSLLNNCKLHSKYPEVKLCPRCSAAGVSIFDCALDLQGRCKACKNDPN